jgi:hypothetical protein
MYPETYTKFYVFLFLALVLGMTGMEVATGGLELPSGELTGMVAASPDAEPLIGSGELSFVYLFLGLLAGALIAGVALHVYFNERPQE